MRMLGTQGAARALLLELLESGDLLEHVGLEQVVAELLAAFRGEVGAHAGQVQCDACATLPGRWKSTNGCEIPSTVHNIECQRKDL